MPGLKLRAARENVVPPTHVGGLAALPSVEQMHVDDPVQFAAGRRLRRRSSPCSNAAASVAWIALPRRARTRLR